MPHHLKKNAGSNQLIDIRPCGFVTFVDAIHVRSNSNDRIGKKDIDQVVCATGAFGGNSLMKSSFRAMNRSHRRIESVAWAMVPTPAIKAGVTDHVWTIDDIADLLPEQKHNTPRKKREIDSTEPPPFGEPRCVPWAPPLSWKQLKEKRTADP